MEKITVNRRDTNFFSDLANQINDNQEALQEFIQFPVNLSNFEKQIQLKQSNYPVSNRKVLCDVLKEQLSPYLSYEKVDRNLKLLEKENTFTITAGHQLSLYGGPLYLIYKIIDAVRLAEKLSEKYTDFNFVPVFWMATEDHDFAEINHIHLFNDTLSWDSAQQGPVGRFSLTGIEEFKQSVADKFSNDEEFANYINQCYSKKSLAEATTRFLMDLVGVYGVLILDADNPHLKKLFTPLMQKEIETEFAEKEIIQQTNRLEEKGYFGQAFPRPVNLFFIKDQLRERIIPLENGDFEVGDKTYTKNELLGELANHPECFSPNVVFRPLYQETILPNLCYLGGGGEMAYWLQLKGMFEKAQIPFPIIKVRNSIQWIDKTTAKRIQKLELDYTDIFTPEDEVKKRFVFANSEEELDFTVLDNKLSDFIKVLEETIVQINKGLEGYSKSETVRIQKQIDSIKQKLIREQKKQYDDAMRQIESIYAKMFPNNGLQERAENMIPFLAKFGKKNYLKMLYEILDNPFQEDLILVIEED